MKEKRKMKKENKIKRINKILELPIETYSDIPKIVIIGFEEMVIENFKGIIEYEEYFIRVNTSIGIININGFNLNLENISNEDIKVKGKIESFEFEKIIDEE